jgi:hypothetical protein
MGIRHRKKLRAERGIVDRDPESWSRSAARAGSTATTNGQRW